MIRKFGKLIYLTTFVPLLILYACTDKASSISTLLPPSPTFTLHPTDMVLPSITSTQTQTPPITPTHEPLYASTATAVPVENKPLLFAHYMPWYQAPPIDSTWGWHWTMNHFNPDTKDVNGRREIASYFYPQIGPYDSRDPAVLEYQVLLMKLSGIDGVIVDWYGTENFYDYAILNDSTKALFSYIKKAGLLFSICYEDQTIGIMVKNSHITASDAQKNAQKEMLYLQDNWFIDNAYLRASEAPVLFVFGPQYFKSATEWENVFSVLNATPVFISEDNPLAPVTTSSYPWPPMWASQNGVLSQQAAEDYLSSFYKKGAFWKYWVASAFPGFKDIYKEAGVSAGYGVLDASNGDTFKTTLQLAFDAKPNAIQLVTWNDYGEGTNIEPTDEYGNLYLGIIQDEIRTSINPKFPYTIDDLSLALQLYQLRKQYEGNAEVNQQLDQVFSLVTGNKLDEAKTILAKYPVKP